MVIQPWLSMILWCWSHKLIGCVNSMYNNKYSIHFYQCNGLPVKDNDHSWVTVQPFFEQLDFPSKFDLFKITKSADRRDRKVYDN